MVPNQTDSPDSLRRSACIVACWCLAISLLPPNGLVWQFGMADAFGHWLVNGVLASLNLTGLVR